MKPRLRRAAPVLAGPMTIGLMTFTVAAQSVTLGATVAALIGSALIVIGIVMMIVKPPSTPQPIDWRAAAAYSAAAFFLALGTSLGVAGEGDLASWIGAVVWPLICLGWGYHAVRRRREKRWLAAARDSSAAVTDGV